MIAGKIIPAIATATAMIVGAVGFEIYKFLGVSNYYENLCAYKILLEQENWNLQKCLL